MEYQPLNQDEIRLVILLPRGRNDAIECRIVQSKISDKPDYEALSYEWGMAEPAQRIIMDGIDRHITPNLWSALYHLRLQENERVLWIDALCINQIDITERNHQVQLMG
ncbi:HET-domain-containing protein, partial [Stipitochalara longipes BDJ]